MGSFMSSQISQKDQDKRHQLEKQLKRMRSDLRITAASHYVASEYYKKWHLKLQYASGVTGVLGTTGTVLSKLAWKTIIAKYPRLAPTFGATSGTFLAFTIAANSPIPDSPGTSAKQHFISGIECQYLEKRVQFFVESEVWDYEVPWSTLATKYEKLLQEKKVVNSRIKCMEWSYRVALEKPENSALKSYLLKANETEFKI